MPYIKDRALFENGLLKFFEQPPRTAGELNYVITMLCADYFKAWGGKYQQINDIIGALEGAKLEFYRRVAAPYEDQKIKENGDVY